MNYMLGEQFYIKGGSTTQQAWSRDVLRLGFLIYSGRVTTWWIIK